MITAPQTARFRQSANGMVRRVPAPPAIDAVRAPKTNGYKPDSEVRHTLRHQHELRIEGH